MDFYGFSLEMPWMTMTGFSPNFWIPAVGFVEVTQPLDVETNFSSSCQHPILTDKSPFEIWRFPKMVGIQQPWFFHVFPTLLKMIILGCFGGTTI